MSFERNESTGYLINHLARVLARELTDAIAPFGLAPAQFMTLLILWERDGLTQAQLVERLDVEQATLALTLRRMERDGFVRSSPHPDDKRAKLYVLSERAKALEVPAKAAAQAVNMRALAGLSEVEAAQFLDLVKRVLQHMRAENPKV